LESAVAGAIKAHVAAKNELALTTPDDDKLQTCAVCSCHLPLKVWVPLEKVLRDTSVHGLPPHCWIVNEKPARPKLAIRRHISHGDVIATSVLAERIADHGYDVTLVCAPHVADALHHHKRISISSGTHHDINLDSTYESSPQLATKSIYELFWDAANTQLRRFGFDIGTATNCLPNLVVTDDEKQKMRAKMPLGKKNIVIVPKSNWSKNRVVPEPIWRNVATAIGSDYACYWTSTNEKCFPPLTNLSVKTFRETMAALALADLVVTVDTGPMHAAAGLKKPVLAIQQAFRIDLRLTDHTDWQSVGADLDCLGCCKYYCPINKDEPPCWSVPSKVIADAIVERFKIFDMTRVAAVVPVYKPNRDRLERCIKAIEDQVSEIVIALDGDAVVDCKHPKVRVVKNPTGKRTGYGKTIMRGARLTNSGWILQLNDDCYMNPGAVAKMVEAADERTAIVGCLLRYPDGRIQHGGIVMGKEIGWGHIDHLKTEPSIRTVVDAPGVTLAAGLTRRSAFYEVGGFDDEFDCYGEDEDICRTFRRDGWKIRYTPFASGVHDEHQTSGSSRAGMMEASHAILRRKWLVKK
jgi:GT2 family glycosyltransferase/ADP-heptose:LPS heptosyltransferase